MNTSSTKSRLFALSQEAILKANIPISSLLDTRVNILCSTSELHSSTLITEEREKKINGWSEVWAEMKQVSSQSLVILLLSDYLPGKAAAQLKWQTAVLTVKS